MSFVNTDEVFAVASAKGRNLKKAYLYGLILTPYIGWSIGTAVGAVAGNVLPQIIISSLSLCDICKFVAIVLPVTKKSRPTAVCVIISIVLGCMFKYVPALSSVADGFVLIICAAAAAQLWRTLRRLTSEEGEMI